jgi:hypothetical protein
VRRVSELWYDWVLVAENSGQQFAIEIPKRGLPEEPTQYGGMVVTDPGETRSVMAEHPQIAQRLIAHAVAAHGRGIRPVGHIRAEGRTD